MKIRHPWLIRIAAWLGATAVRLLLATIRRQTITADGLDHPLDVSQGRFIYTFWHETLLGPVCRRGNVSVLISLHADGELITQICHHLGVATVRGSTTRRGGAALLELLERARNTHLAITPDGPRGPRRQVQIGAVYLASRTGLPIVPIGIGFARAWRAASWDRFAIPLPFSRGVGVVGAPIEIPPGLDREGLEQYRQLVEQRMLETTALAETWASNPDSPPDFAAEKPAGDVRLRSA